MIYLDTGCLVKLHYPEPDSALVIAAIQGKPIIFTSLHELEFSNALSLKAFLGAASVQQLQAARSLVAQDLRSGVLVWAETDRTRVFSEASQLAEHHSPAIGCRSLDILHCAAAKTLAVPEFITTDARQKKLAVAMGLNAVIF